MCALVFFLYTFKVQKTIFGTDLGSSAHSSSSVRKFFTETEICSKSEFDSFACVNEMLAEVCSHFIFILSCEQCLEVDIAYIYTFIS